MFYLTTHSTPFIYEIWNMVKDHLDGERGKHGILKGSFISTNAEAG